MTIWAARTTNIPVSFDKLRKMWLTAPMQEGVVNAGDLKVSQRAAGANMSVDVAPGQFWVRTDIDTPDGLVPGYSDAIGNFAVAAAHATLPRIDALYLQYNDSSLGAGVGGDTPTLRLLTGTPTTGAQATNFAGANYRAGAPTPPNDALLIADIPVPPAAASITNANIVDRRPNARGAFAEIVYTGTTSQAAPTTFGAIPVISAAIQQRVECSGAPLIIELDVSRITSPAAVSNVQANPVVDGSVPAAITDTPGSGGYLVSSNAAAAVTAAPTKRWRYTPSAGSHLITINGVGTAGNALFASSTYPLRLTIWEDLRSIFNNGTA